MTAEEDRPLPCSPAGRGSREGCNADGEGAQQRGRENLTTPARRLAALKPNGLLARLLAPYLFTLVAVAVALYAYSDRVVEDFYVDTLSENVLRQARLVGDLLPWDLRGPAMDQRCAAIAAEIGARVTVIAADGTVLGDSDAPSAELENHGERPEVQAALATGEGQAVRTSVSVNRPPVLSRLAADARARRRERAARRAPLGLDARASKRPAAISAPPFGAASVWLRWRRCGRRCCSPAGFRAGCRA